MIWITGDMHGDINRFKENEIKKLKKTDTLIICGDFGFIWDGSEKEKKVLSWIGKRKYNVLFVEGCHENYSELEKYETTEWNGGKVRQITGNLRQLLRGEVYGIDGVRLFSFGGGDSADSEMRVENETWWKREQPTSEEVNYAFKNLSEYGNEMDVIITHDTPMRIKRALENDLEEKSFINSFLEIVAQDCTFKSWYFGKYHLDRIIPPKYIGVYKKLLPVDFSIK